MSNPLERLVPGTDLTFQQALDLMPPSIKNEIKNLPEDELEAALQQLLQRRQLEFRVLTAEDFDNIKARTLTSQQYGFQQEDVDFTWDDVNEDTYIAIGAYASDGEEETLAGFVIAEVITIQDTPEYKEGSKLSQLLLQQDGSPYTARDNIIGIYFLGVDFEYRRQGIAMQLLDSVAAVAEQIRVRMMWLQVNEKNAPAVNLYSGYGFKKTDEFVKGETDTHYLFVYEFPLPKAKKKRAPAKKARNAPAGGGGFGAADGDGGGGHGGEGGMGRGMGAPPGGIKPGRRRKKATRAYCLPEQCAGDVAVDSSLERGDGWWGHASQEQSLGVGRLVDADCCLPGCSSGDGSTFREALRGGGMAASEVGHARGGRGDAAWRQHAARMGCMTTLQAVKTAQQAQICRPGSGVGYRTSGLGACSRPGRGIMPGFAVLKGLFRLSGLVAVA